MIVLLIGSGGREHALAWKIVQSPRLSRLVAAPGNPGIAGLCEVRPVRVDDLEALTALALEIKADLVVVGPEAALAAGIADRLAAAGVPCFGPSAAAARLESSKAFAKAFCDRRGLPTARHRIVRCQDDVAAALDAFSPPYVVKADGLAAGKGVVVTPHRTEAEAAIVDMLAGRRGGDGAQIVVEEFLPGEEASFFALCDGETVVPFGGAQDHKRAYDGDLGPNTGGMGAYAPAPILTAAVSARALETLVAPAVAGLATEGAPYRGVLYAGLMVEAGLPRLVEFNVRFGDPECQVLMLRLQSDVLAYLYAAATGALRSLPAPQWRSDAVICVVLAANGYPDAPRSGSVILGAEADFGEDVAVFHAGTRRLANGSLIASGGRVLNVCARGPDLAAARDKAYAVVDQIRWPGGFHRRDIAWRAL